MTQAKAMARVYKTFKISASLTIVTYDHQNFFIIQPTGSERAKSFISLMMEKVL
jgi:hypothetical protein